MKLLLLPDTHTLLWFLTDNTQLSRKALEATESPDTEVSTNIVSLWEIAIKSALGRLTLPAPFEQVFPAQLEINHIACLQIAYEALHHISHLPLHHRDPFDRVIIAQAFAGNLTLVTCDDQLKAYGASLLW